jgi:CRP-like cAMP-binding protein
MNGSSAASLQVEELIPLEFFDGYTPAELRDLIPYLEVCTYSPSDGPIYSEDLRRKGIQLILAGEVQIVKEVSEEALIVLATLRRGEIIGEASMFDEGPHTASVRATEPTRTIAITRSAYFAMVRDAPGIAVKIANKAAQVLSDRLRQANEAVLTYAIWSRSLSKSPPPTFWRWHVFSEGENLTTRDLDRECPDL